VSSRIVSGSDEGAILGNAPSVAYSAWEMSWSRLDTNAADISRIKQQRDHYLKVREIVKVALFP
jgi:hypothetical protein